MDTDNIKPKCQRRGLAEETKNDIFEISTIGRVLELKIAELKFEECNGIPRFKQVIFVSRDEEI